VTCYIHDVKSLLELRSLRDGSLIQNFPIEVGTISGFSGKKEHSEFFFQFVSFLTPGRIYHVDFQKQPLEPKVLNDFNVRNYNRLYVEFAVRLSRSRTGYCNNCEIDHTLKVKIENTNEVFLHV